MARKWTEDEDIYLEYFVYEHDAKLQDAADFLGRTRGSVDARLQVLRKKNKNVAIVNKRWTEKEIELLKKYYGTETIAYIAKRLGRSVSAVHCKKNELGLRKVNAMKNYDKEIRKLAEEGQYGRKIARTLGLPYSSIIGYTKANGIELRKATKEECVEKWKEYHKRESSRIFKKEETK